MKESATETSRPRRGEETDIKKMIVKEAEKHRRGKR